MDWNGPIYSDYSFEKQPPADRFQYFLGHYDARVYLSDVGYVDVGAGSLSAEARISMIPVNQAGPLGRIGRFCEFGTCEIMALGEHDNDSPVNIGFGSTPLLSLLAIQHRVGELRKTDPIDIGDNVVISNRAQVLPGVKVATGCVIGAGAVVTKNTEPFGIYAGVPARRIGDRTPCQPWWHFATAYMMENVARLPDLARSAGPHPYREDRPRFVFRRRANEIGLLGFLDGEVVRSVSEVPERVRAYLTQAFDPLNPRPYWLADCWA